MEESKRPQKKKCERARISFITKKNFSMTDKQELI